MPQQVHLGAAGLWLDPSPIAQKPDGAMAEAQNVVIRRPGVIEPRPSLEPLSRPSSFDSMYQIQKIIPYRGSRLVVTGQNTANNRLWSWTDNQEIKDEDAASIATSCGQRSHTETDRALYLTTDSGVRRLTNADDATAYRVGMPDALSGWCYDDGAASALWLPTQTAVAYRVVWVRRVNEQDLYSAPSPRFLCVNFQSPAASAGPVVGIPIPPDIVATDRLQIYRSGYTSGSYDPPDDMRLLEEIEMTSSDISAGYYSYIDAYDDDERVGAYLYTNADQEGALQANSRPNHARCICEFNGMMFYGGVEGPHELTLTLIKGLFGYWVVDSAVSLTSGVATFTVSGGVASYLKVGMPVTDSSNTGDFTAASTYFSGDTYITDVTGTTVTVSPAPIATGSANLVFGGVFKIDSTKHKAIWNGTIEINDVAYQNGNFFPYGVVTPGAAGWVSYGLQQLAASINAYDPTCYAVVSGGVNQRITINEFGTPLNKADRQASITIRRRDLTDTPFSVYATYPDYFTGESLDWTTATTSTYGGGPHRLAWSKKDQPEAAPALQFQDLGHKDQPILAMAKAAESLFVFKTDGVWRVTGETPETLRIEEFDRELVLVHPEAICSFRDEVYCWTNRGLMVVSSAGTRAFGVHQLKSTLRATAASLMYNIQLASPVFSSSIQMFASETRDEVYLLTRSYGAANSTADYCYVYNFHTDTWVRWTFNSDYHYVYSGAWDKANGVLLFGGNRKDTVNDSLLLEESVGAFTRAHDSWGYDEQFTCTVTDITSGTWTITAHATYVPKVGDIVGKDTFVGRITAKTSSTVFDVETLTGTPPTPSTTVTINATNRAIVKWSTEHVGAPGIRKHWRDLFLMTDQWLVMPSAAVDFAGDDNASGSIVLGSYVASDVFPRVYRGSVSRNAARSAILDVQLTIDQFYTNPFQITGVGLTFEPESERFRWP